MNSRRTGLKSNKRAAASTILVALVVVTLWLAITGRSPTIAADDSKPPPAANFAKVAAESVSESARTFVADTCTRCHNGTKKTARLELSSLAYDPDDRGNFALWVKIHDRVAAGEMPLEEAKQPDPANRSAFVVSLAETFMSSEKRQMAGEGRSTQRRMNRYEYESALRDLLGVPTAQIADQLPQDGEANGGALVADEMRYIPISH